MKANAKIAQFNAEGNMDWLIVLSTGLPASAETLNGCRAESNFVWLLLCGRGRVQCARG